MRLFFIIILGTMAFAGLSLAQEEDNVDTATSALQDVLSTLKQSVTKLAVDNDQLTARDNAMKAEVSKLQAQLDQLQIQGDFLNKAGAQLQGKNPRRAERITNLEQENFDLDNRIQKAGSEIKLIQAALDSGYEEDQKLLLRLKGLSNTLPVSVQTPTVESNAAGQSQKEKLILMKMIYDSQQRQEALHEEILNYQKSTSLQLAASAMAHQQVLKDQVKDLETEMASYPQSKFPANGLAQWDDTQLRQLESELKVLERNYSQLKDLMGEMNKKAQSARMSVAQHAEGEKLQDTIDELNRQAVGLRADLDDLRSQMVDLDKRKSHLEEMIKQLQ